MDTLWSISTTMRNPLRAFDFLKTAKEMENMEWNDENQKVFQSLLIKNRFYVPTVTNLNQQQIKMLEDYSFEMTYEQARDIFDSKNYKDAAMRGRTSLNPLVKWGIVGFNNVKGKKYIKITRLGEMFLDNEIKMEDVVFSNFLKLQFPNPVSEGFEGYNTKPFINTLRIIKRVNELCSEKGLKSKGVSRLEFGIFVLSLKNYLDIDNVSKKILKFRNELENREEADKEVYIRNYINDYLSTFCNPLKNIKEYSDNIIRCLRLTKYIYIRGGGYYIDLEPRRMTEIDSLLEYDKGSAKIFTAAEYEEYMSDYYAYKLPFETEEKLKAIVRDIRAEISHIKGELGLKQDDIIIADGILELKNQIDRLREERTKLQNIKLKKDFQSTDKIDKAIESLINFRKLPLKPSVALEKWTNVALNIINDSVLIKPNAPIGDDNEPTYTAPAGVPDIECEYDGFASICEVTGLTSRDQWYNEGQPVMRHLREYEEKHKNIDNYCLFVAPKIHVDTINTFWNAVRYEYQGKPQKIIPMTITQFTNILTIFKKAKTLGKVIGCKDMKVFYDRCTNISTLENSTKWGNYINLCIKELEQNVVGVN